MYRRNKIVISSDWHFSEQCPHSPLKDFIEATSIDADKGARVCTICTGLSVVPSKPLLQAPLPRPPGT